MRKSTQAALRTTLRLYTDGLTIAQLAHATGLQPRSIAHSLKCMPDAYIDRWEPKGPTRVVSAVWCTITPPENCPKPTFKGN